MKFKKVLAIIVIAILTLAVIFDYFAFFNLDAGLLLYFFPQTQYVVPIFGAVAIAVLSTVFEDEYLADMRGIDLISQINYWNKTFCYIMIFKSSFSFITSNTVWLWWIISIICGVIVSAIEVVYPMITRPGLK